MPLILNEDGSVYEDVPSIEEIQHGLQNIVDEMHIIFLNTSYAEAISTLSYGKYLEMCYGNFQNHRGEASNSHQPVPQETKAGRSNTCTYGRTASGKSTKALSMGTPVGIGRRVEEETS